MRYLVATVVLSLTGLAALPPLPVSNGIPVRLDAYRLPNGMSTVPVQFLLHRAPDQYLPGVVLVKTRRAFGPIVQEQGFRSTALQKALASVQVRAVRAIFPEYASQLLQSADPLGIGRIYEVRYAAPVDPYDVCALLLGNPDVEYAEPVYRRFPLYTPNDPRFPNQQFLQWIAAPAAWDITRGADTVTIAIIDSGTDWEHEDLRANIWTNPREIPNNGIDDDGNGKVDDVHGWDFVGNVTLQEALNGQFREDNDPKVRPSATGVLGHGTQTAGCASAVTDNATGVASVGFRCKLIPIKCASDNPQAAGIFRGYEAILYAARLGADVINCSWGGPGGSLTEYQIIQEAMRLGALVVAGVGNNGTNIDVQPFYPASYPGVLSVGGTSTATQVASWSNYGVTVQVYAPGESILTTSPENGYGSPTGTSFSGPIVAGTVALVRTLHPDWTPMQLLHQIRSTAENVLAPSPTQRPLYYGRLNAQRAVAINRRLDQGTRLPGIGLADTALLISSPSGAIESYDPYTVQLRLKNYLGPATNVTVRLESVDGYATVTPAQSAIGAMAPGETKPVQLTVQLRPNNPWYAGTVTFLATVEDAAQQYANYFYVSIPLQLPTQNAYTPAFGVPSSYVFYSAHAPQPQLLWAVGTLQGQQGVFLRYRVGQNPVAGTIASVPVYALYAFDDLRAVAGSAPSNGQAAVHLTQNGGTSWQQVSVASITPFVNDIHFFSAQEGILLGDPIGTTWGIARTNNGGQSWQRVSGVPPALSGEAGLVGSVWWWGDTCWFGTTMGRVFRSTDRGQSWQVSQLPGVSGYVTQVVFRNGREGIAIYRVGSGQTASYMVARSTDGGQSWQTNVANLSSLGFLPVYGYAPPNSWEIVLLGINGAVLATADLGQNWRPVLTLETGGIMTTGAGVPVAPRARLWNVGTVVGYLDFAYARTNVRKELTAPPSLDFDTVQLGFTRTRLLALQNTGDTAVVVQQVELQPIAAQEGEFSLVNPPTLPQVLQPGATLTLRVRFEPRDTAERTVQLRALSTATNSPTVVLLRGRGVGPSAIASGDGRVAVHAVVEDGVLQLRLRLPEAGWVQLELYNLLGERLLSEQRWGSAGEQRWTFPGLRLSPGVYLWQLRWGGEYRRGQLLVAP